MTFNVSLGDFLNAMLVIVGMAALIVPLHQQNRAAIAKQGRMAKKALKAIRRHTKECCRYQRNRMVAYEHREFREGAQIPQAALRKDA